MFLRLRECDDDVSYRTDRSIEAIIACGNKKLVSKKTGKNKWQKKNRHLNLISQKIPYH